MKNLRFTIYDLRDFGVSASRVIRAGCRQALCGRESRRGRGNQNRCTEKSAIQQVWKPAARWWAILCVVAVCGLANEVRAQWVQQQIVLRPGWNAVYLEVEPAPKECDVLFAGLPVESVWDLNRPTESAQFMQDTNTLIPGARGWLTWFPPNHPFVNQTSLFILRDGRPYLIKLANNAPVTTWTVTGKPSLRGIQWRAGGVNLVGFHVATNPAPSFTTLFAGETGLAAQPVFRLATSGMWEQIANLATTSPKAGEAYWVRCRRPATRVGTIEVNTGSREGLIFGSDAVERSVRIRNTSASPRNIFVRVRPSAMPPAGEPALAGVAPLEYRDANYLQAQFDWKPLTNTLSFAALPVGAEWNVRLAVRRAGLNAPAGSEFQSVLEVMDDAGTRWLIPVSVEPAASSSGGGLQSISSEPSHPRSGLWVGEAVINAVSQPAHPGDPMLTRPTGGDFEFRLLVHVDATGIARLLQHVFLIRKPPTFIPDPENPDVNIIDQPARSVVVTDETLIPGILGTAEIVGRRLSSAAFGFKQPFTLAGPFGGGTLTGTIGLDYDHPLNPFRHIYHPDHNNLDERFEQKLPEGKESFSVTRALSLEFAATDPQGLNPPGWGDTELGGTYRETISGVHRSAIQVSGNFRLVRVLPTATLNE